jgi:hypothetical protein
VEPRSSSASELRSTDSSERVERSEFDAELPRTLRSRERTAFGLFGDRAREREIEGVSVDRNRGARVEHRLFGGGARARATPRNGSGNASIRLVGSSRISSEVHRRPAAELEGVLAGSNVSAGRVARPYGGVRRRGAQTTDLAGSGRADGAGDKTLEAGQGHERTPNRFTATRQLGRRTPRRVRAVTVSRCEAHGGSAQPIRR